MISRLLSWIESLYENNKKIMRVAYLIYKFFFYVHNKKSDFCSLNKGLEAICKKEYDTLYTFSLILISSLVWVNLFELAIAI